VHGHYISDVEGRIVFSEANFVASFFVRLFRQVCTFRVVEYVSESSLVKRRQKHLNQQRL